eukprot:5627679-Ditylum_brightwellii.AAC.1
MHGSVVKLASSLKGVPLLDANSLKSLTLMSVCLLVQQYVCCCIAHIGHTISDCSSGSNDKNAIMMVPKTTWKRGKKETAHDGED